MMIADRSVAVAAEAFWNAVEAFETRTDAQLAKEFIIALPVELSAGQNIALVREFVETQVLARGQVADWVFHAESGNPHIHLMTTLRPLTEDGFGPKKVPVIGTDGQPLCNDAGKIVYRLWSGEKAEFLQQREGWLDLQNRHLALAGLDVRVDGRSYAEQGVDLVPTTHIGVAAKAIDRKEAAAAWSPRLERIALHEACRAENRARILRQPEIVLDLVTREMSVFTERDIAKVLHRYVDDADTFRQILARILQSPDVLRLESERIGFATGTREPARSTTRELIRLEAEMANRAIWLSGRSSHGVRDEAVAAVFERHARLSQEQRVAIAHVASIGRLAAVVGRAGAGKTTMMKAAREAWEAAGYRVVGAALAGKAAEGLEQEAGITSRTPASWELAWSKGGDLIDDRTIFILDEAGMVSSRQMALLVETMTTAGAKVVLVGDPDQLQPIEAGAAFRAILDRTGYAELETIYRQREQWMRDASLDLARGNVTAALKAYEANGRLEPRTLKSDAIAALIEDWNRDYDPAKSTLILAHLRRDVRTLNDMARATLVERGIVAEGDAFRTEGGIRRFAAGDQIGFLKNEGSLAVKNGMIGHVVEAREGWFAAMVGEGELRRRVEVDQRFYANVDHGYATTIHKSQGSTVDRVKALATLAPPSRGSQPLLRCDFVPESWWPGEDPVAAADQGNDPRLCAGQHRAALHFAEARGLHLVRVARTLVSDKLRWTVRQKHRLVDLGARLVAFSTNLGLGHAARQAEPNSPKEAKPMVAGITAFARSLDQVVEDRLAADPALKTQWEEVSTRFRFVFADPEAAFRKVDVDAMMKSADTAKLTLATIAQKPESFGALKGGAGLLAGRAEKQDRERAMLNVPALARELERYLRLRAEAERKYEAEEWVARAKVALNIPALSPAAKVVLERVRDAIERHDQPGALVFSREDKNVKAELEGFARAVSERFGERVMLPNAAKTPDGAAFEKLAAGMNAGQRKELKTAWLLMRTAQQLAAQERMAEALKQAETMRQSQRQGLSLK